MSGRSGQSPPPESQTGRQLHEVPGSGQGVDETANKGENMKSQVDNLASNPTGPLEKSLEEKFAKTEPPRSD